MKISHINKVSYPTPIQLRIMRLLYEGPRIALELRKALIKELGTDFTRNTMYTCLHTMEKVKFITKETWGGTESHPRYRWHPLISPQQLFQKVLEASASLCPQLSTYFIPNRIENKSPDVYDPNTITFVSALPVAQHNGSSAQFNLLPQMGHG